MTFCITGAILALVFPTRLHDRALGQLGKTMLAALLLFAPIAVVAKTHANLFPRILQ